MKEALVDKTLKIIEEISKMEFPKSFYLVGGTALSLQIKHRLSEDLDFMCWQKTKTDKQNIDLQRIKTELSRKFTINKTDILEYNHIEIYIENDVKLSFYAPEKREPKINPVHFLNNLILCDIECIAALKMEVMLRRNEFRDYYDIYSILQNQNIDLQDIIQNALKYSQHNLKSKNLIGMLTNSDRFKQSADFQQLKPKYNITSKEIETFLLEKLSKNLNL
ncbi:MAG: nucleotidyl transferase AbiEii/AbiGii toxin family protein [Prevotellaceae bacterium]|jgi:predicted nucleotidyltransferase component of viral defense system|nr:nucleotidyl transferase AbiEii/AbiGii toxin family protein [Prevotellaceae bacterium]